MNESDHNEVHDFGQVMLDLAKKVAHGELGTHDDRSLLMPKEQLIEALSSISMRDIQELIDNQLIIPVEYEEEGIPLFHIANCIEFLRFLEELEQAGFPLILQQPIAEMYHSVLWAFYSDIDYEISNFVNEHGRQPSKLELAYLKVINEFVVANQVSRMEDNILAGKADELNNAKERAAKWKRAILRESKFGVAESEIEKIVAGVWKPPLKYFRGREIKAFIDISSMTWTKAEQRLIWGGHFDFALCDEKGIICLAIEYQGRGHYGNTNEERIKIRRRDINKLAICEKAGVPLIQLDSKYAFMRNYMQLFEHFLTIFRDKRKNYGQVLTLLRKQLDLIYSRSDKSVRVDPRITDLKHRLDIYEIQEKGENIVGLLWNLHQIETPLSPLPIMLKILDR